MAYPI
jgi:hypothetical protein